MKRQILFFFLALVGVVSTEAKVQLPRLFQSGMVLQRNKPIPVWGKADPQERSFSVGTNVNMPRWLTMQDVGALTCRR